MDGDVRAGDNLYTCSLVAIDADTGKLKWHFQFTPHDTHDWDAVADPVLIDLNIKGQAVKAVVQANRNGYFYALDRTNGKFLLASPYTKVNWATGIAADGRPLMVAGPGPVRRPEPKSVLVWAAGTTGRRQRTASRRSSSTSVRTTAASCSSAPSRSFEKGSGIRRAPTPQFRASH